MSNEKTEETIPDGFLSLNSFLKFEESGQSIDGQYLGYEWVRSVSSEAPYPIYTVFSDLHGIVRFAGTVQMSILLNIPVGTLVRVVYHGEEKKNGKSLRHFDVRCPGESVRFMVDAMIAAGGMKAISPPKLEAVQTLLDDNGNEIDPFAE